MGKLTLKYITVNSSRLIIIANQIYLVVLQVELFFKMVNIVPSLIK